MIYYCCTWQRRPALPLCAFHHLFGHALCIALLSFLLHQLLQLSLARGDAALVRRRSGYGLYHLNGRERCGFPGLHGSGLRHLWLKSNGERFKIKILVFYHHY